jgi:zona occludens toxin
MRHRHHNWDIAFATPDIKEVIGFVRSATEVAFAHVSKDAIPFPYFKRRPRVLEHSPKEAGTTIKSNSVTTNRKIPLDVFKLYKSTATGKTTKSGASSSPVDWRHYVGFTFILTYIIYLVYFLSDSDDVPQDLPNPAVSFTQKSKIEKGTKENNQLTKKSLSGSDRDALEAASVTARNGSVSELFAPDNNIKLPYNAQSMHLSGLVTERFTKTNVKRHYLFNLVVEGSKRFISSDDLYQLGYKVFYKSDCLVELRSDTSSNFVYCELIERDTNPVIDSNRTIPAVKGSSLDSSLIASLN